MWVRSVFSATVVVLTAGIASAEFSAKLIPARNAAMYNYWQDEDLAEETAEEPPLLEEEQEPAVTAPPTTTTPECGCLYETCCEPLWTIRAGAVILERSRPRSTPIVQTAGGGTTLLDASDFDFGFAGGLDLSVMRRLYDGGALEVRYFGIDGWQANNSIVTPGVVEFPTVPPLFGLGLASIDSSYRSRLYSTEFNLRHRTNQRVTWLLGFRYVELLEQLSMLPQAAGNTVSIDANTSNHLYGAQVGADALLWTFRSRFYLEGLFKAGLYGNSSDSNFNVTQQIGPDFAAAGSSSHTAFLGEIGITGVYKLTDHLGLRGGYQMLWIESVALASDQFAVTDVLTGTGIDNDGGIFYHGALAGLEYQW